MNDGAPNTQVVRILSSCIALPQRLEHQRWNEIGVADLDITPADRNRVKQRRVQLQEDVAEHAPCDVCRILLGQHVRVIVSPVRELKVLVAVSPSFHLRRRERGVESAHAHLPYAPNRPDVPEYLEVPLGCLKRRSSCYLKSLSAAVCA